jgi:hypothetical protein
MSGGPDRGVTTGRVGRDRDRALSGRGALKRTAPSRVKPLRNYPLVWRKKRQRVSLGMLAQRAVRPARNADGGTAVVLTYRRFTGGMDATALVHRRGGCIGVARAQQLCDELSDCYVRFVLGFGSLDPFR